MYLKCILILFASIILSASSWGAKLPAEECCPIVKQLETLSNVNPKDVELQAPLVLEKLRNGESLTYYFIAYNIYVENLFNQGKIRKAGLELDTMINEALNQNDPECQVIALRTKGQFYYKLGLYKRAAETFRNAMKVCPWFDSDKLCSYFTWSSTLFGLVQADIQIGEIKEAEQWLAKMDEMMLWLDDIGQSDKVGYKPVMILGLKAKIALQKDDIITAKALLEKCPQYIRSDIPSRAYVEYFVGEMMLAVKEGRNADAIPLLDQLIEIHLNDYKPIAANFLYQKAKSLYELGLYKESAQAFKQYEDLQSQVYDLAIAHQLDELRTRFDVEKLEHDQDKMRNNLIVSIIICIALLLFIALVTINQKKLRQKNRVLAKTISNLHQLSKQHSGMIEPQPEMSPEPASNITPDVAPTNDHGTDTTSDSAQTQEYIDMGNRIVYFILTSKCYLNKSCGRDTIKDALGISEQLLSKSLPMVTGKTFVKYINHLRLDYAIGLLDNHPEITINKISTMCGFGTLRQFQRIFKQQYDLTPSAYREAREESKKTNSNV